MRHFYQILFTFLVFNIAPRNSVFAQSAELNQTNNTVPLEIPHCLKIDSSGQIQKWVIGNLKIQTRHHLKIYDRNGNLVFQTKDYQNEWPNQSLANNKYFYILDIDDKRINGWIRIED